MNKETVNQKLVNNEFIRDYFLWLSFKKKSAFRSLKENITENYTILSNVNIFVLFLSVIALLMQFNDSLLSLVKIKEHEEMIKIGFGFCLAFIILYFVAFENSFSVAPFSLLGMMIFLTFAKEKNSVLEYFFEYLCVFVMMLPVILNIGSLLYISLCGLLFRKKNYDLNISQSDHKMIKEYMNKEEMIVFLKNFKKYYDLPLEKMKGKRKECQVKEQERLSILSKEKKIEEYTESLYE